MKEMQPFGAIPTALRYDYEPLASPRTQIRLCRLLRDEEDSAEADIKVEIEHASLPHLSSLRLVAETGTNDKTDRGRKWNHPDVVGSAEPRQYVALSYMWGTSESCRYVQIKGHVLAISDNLWDFLSMIRSKQDFNTWYFIDQISINQASINERNDQVKLMSVVYAQASKVHVWLGEASDTSSDAMQLLKELEAWATPDLRPFRINESKYVRDRSSLEVAKVRELMQRPYWSRLWIIQELFHAKELVFLCGMDVYEPSTSGFGLFNDFEAARLLFRRAFPNDESASHPRTLPLANHPLLWRILRGRRKILRPLDELIAHFCNQKCADPRDCVFGLLGCAKDQEQIQVRYELPVEEVFWRTVSSLCEYWRRGLYVDGIEKSIFHLRDNMGLDGQHGMIKDDEIKEAFERWMGRN